MTNPEDEATAKTKKIKMKKKN